jgi:5-methylcytosine-specific restriction endonuclease McrA
MTLMAILPVVGGSKGRLVVEFIPHKGNEALFWDESNWQSLCKFHHDQKTGRDA